MERLTTEHWDEEISALSNEIVNGIEEILSEMPNNKIEFKIQTIVDGVGSSIKYIELANIEPYGDDVYITTTDCENSLLREEPISVLMDIAWCINNFIIK